MLNIVFCGNLSAHSLSGNRLRWMERLGHQVQPLNQEKFFPYRISKLWDRVENKIGYGPRYRAFNQELLAAVKKATPDILWIEKGVAVFPETLRQCRNYCGRIVSFHTDDPFGYLGYFGKRNWRHHLAGVQYYDVCFVIQQQTALDYLHLGAAHAYRCFVGFDPLMHRPLQQPVPVPKIADSVIFLGKYEPSREPILEAVLKVTKNLYISGWNWDHCRSQALRQANVISPAGLWGDDYAAAISQAGIVLGLLTRYHRDFCTNRSFEIPACGGFMLAERTVEHQLLFKEGVEADYWSDLDQLCDKIKHYLTHIEEARAMGHRGRQRALAAGYGYDQCLPRWFEYAMNPRGGLVSDFSLLLTS